MSSTTERVRPVRWWVTTERLERGGKKVAGPFGSLPQADKERSKIERREGHNTYWLDSEDFDVKVEEPKHLLAVIADVQGRYYFRWSYDVHTFAPWRLVGAVHVDTEEDFRWSDLTGSRRPVGVLSEGHKEMAQ